MRLTRKPYLSLAFLVSVLALATAALATTAFGVDPTSAVTFEGPVVAFTGGYGAGTPTLTVDDAAEGEVSVRLGPFWFLAEAGFTAAPGDVVRLAAYPCVLCSASWVAGTVENLTTGSIVVLRDENGLPLWNDAPAASPGSGPAGQPGPGGKGSGGMGPGGKGMGGRGPGAGGPAAGAGTGCAHLGGPWAGRGPGQGAGLCWEVTPDLAQAASASGTVVSFTGQPGVRFPVLTLEVNGDELSLVASPYRLWMSAGFEPQVGQVLEVTYAPVTFQDGTSHLVALAVTDPQSGLTLVLRDAETGRPLGGRCAP